jgi:hypothetical protein
MTETNELFTVRVHGNDSTIEVSNQFIEDGLYDVVLNNGASVVIAKQVELDVSMEVMECLLTGFAALGYVISSIV